MSLLPEPPATPSRRARRLAAAVRDIATATPEDSDGYTQRVVDIMHILRAAAEPLDQVIYEAVRNPGPVSYRALAAATGMSLGAVQLRANAGDPTRPSRTDEWRDQRRAARVNRAATGQDDDPAS